MRMRCPVCRRWFDAVRDDAVTCSVKCRVARHRLLRAGTPPLPNGPFDLVLVDLPLGWEGYSVKGEGRSPQVHYRTMDVPALCRLPVADVMAKDAAGAFWVYGPRLPDVLRVIEAWGFTYKSELLIWTKVTRAGKPRMGTGKTTRKTSETMWLATRGKGLPIADHGVSQSVITDKADLPITVEAQRRDHSRKPDEAYTALERLFGEVRRLELFARCVRPGWTAWGNEVTVGDPPSVRRLKGPRRVAR
jgi:N6-adenosine-specific RNA methylase IME4